MQEKAGSRKVNYHWIKCSAVRNLEVTGLRHLNLESASLPALDISALEEQARKAEVNYQKQLPSIGVGVTQEAQDVYNSLCKTMPCSWSGKNILCYSVKISPPYTSQDCQGPDSSELERVRKILDGERIKRTSLPPKKI